jgi:hypothetical protein
MSRYVYLAAEWGVVGDGTTDNTSALNTLYSTVAAGGGGIVEYPFGTIKCTGQVTCNGNYIVHRGHGRKRTIIHSTYTAGPAFVLGNSSTQTLEYAFEEMGFTGVAGQTYFWSKYVRGLYFRNIYESTDRFLRLGDATQTATVTITIASPAVITWTAHGFAAGQKLKFTTTGSLPTGLTPGVTYYVLSSGLTANTFQLSATAGGAAINTSGSQSGTHTGTAGKSTYIVHLDDVPDSVHLSGGTPTLHHIYAESLAGQFGMIDTYIEGQYTGGLDGFYCANNFEDRIDHFVVIGGYFSRFRDNYSFVDGRVVNLYIDASHHTEDALRYALNVQVTTSTIKDVAAVGIEHAHIAGTFEGDEGAIFLRCERTGVSFQEILITDVVFNDVTKTPIFIWADVGTIDGVVIDGISVEITPANSSQDVVYVLGGPSSVTLNNIAIDNIAGRALTTALRSVVRVEGQVANVSTPKNMAVTNATTGVDDQTTTTPLKLTSTTVANTDLVNVLDQSAGTGRPMLVSQFTAKARSDPASALAIGADATASAVTGKGVVPATMNDDTATSINAIDSSKSGMMFLTVSSGQYAILMFETSGTSTLVPVVAHADVNVTTGVLSGTTGTDAKFNVSIHTDRKIYFENRLGAAVTMMALFFHS